MDSKEMEMVQFAKAEIAIDQDYRLYTRRYLMAVFFSFSTICSSMMFSTCNPIASDLSSIYSIPTFIVALAANGFLLMHPILTFVQTFLVNQTDIGVSLKVGCTLTLCGALLRSATIFTHRFFTIILGSIISGMGRPFIINIQANVAKEWFKPEDKTSVMMAFSFIITCSSVFGVIVPGQIFRNFDGSVEQGKELTGQLMVFELELFSCILIPAIIFFQAKPPSPPGPVNKTRDEFTYWQSLQLTANNRSFILLLICYSILMGGFHAMAATISYLFAPFGYTSTQISYIQSAPVLFGFLSSIVYSMMIKKFHWNLKRVVMLNLIPVLISLGSAYFAIASESIPIVILCYSVLGFFVIPCIPLQLELACECLYPINQTIAVGFLLGGAHIWSFIFGEFLSFVTYQQTKSQSFAGCMLLFASFLGAALSFYQVKLPNKDEEISDSTQEGAI